VDIVAPSRGATVLPNFEMRVGVTQEDSAVRIEYTFDSTWADWSLGATRPASGTTYQFPVRCDARGYPAPGQTAKLWVKTSDLCGNTIGEEYQVTADPAAPCSPPSSIAASSSAEVPLSSSAAAAVRLAEPLTGTVSDVNGDGIGDALLFRFDSLIDVRYPDSVAWEWPAGIASGSFLPTADQVLVDGKSLYREGDLTTGIATSGNGTAEIFYLEEGTWQRYEVALQELVGPVISRAYLLETASDRDSLYVVVSEGVQQPLALDSSFLVRALSRGAAGDSSLHLLEIRDLGGNQFLLVLDTGWIAPGDSIRFDPTGRVQDLLGNPAHLQNRRTPVGLIGRSLPPVSGIYLDPNVDGSMDRIRILFGETISPNNIPTFDFDFLWRDPDDQPVHLVPGASDLAVASDDDHAVIYVLPSVDRIRPFDTGLDTLLAGKGTLRQGIRREDGSIGDTLFEFPMADGMSPVIASAVLEQTPEWETRPDRLLLNVSEPLEWGSNVALQLTSYKRGANPQSQIEYQGLRATTRGDGATLNFGPNSLLEERPVPGDSVALRWCEGCLQDGSGNRADTSYRLIAGQEAVRMMRKNSQMEFSESASAEWGGDACEAAIVPSEAVADQWLTDEALPTGVLFKMPFIQKAAADGESSTLDLSQYTLRWEMLLYTNLGSFVARCGGELVCNSDFFPAAAGVGAGAEPDCRGSRVMVRWNDRSADGRLVGSGAYLRRFAYRLQTPDVATGVGVKIVKDEFEDMIGIRRVR
jgi:hypothetical protein